MLGVCFLSPVMQQKPHNFPKSSDHKQSDCDCIPETSPIHVNIGGVYFSTSFHTLRRSQYFRNRERSLSSFPSSPSSISENCNEGEKGMDVSLSSPLPSLFNLELFVDRDPTYFRHILNWMRGVRFLPEDGDVLQELEWEASFYGLNDMKTAIQNSKNRYSNMRSLHEVASALKRKDISISYGRGSGKSISLSSSSFSSSSASNY